MKVLVVGASISGLACAESILVNNPVEVTVVDKKPKVGLDVRCACGISLLMVQRVGVSIPESCVAARIRRVRIYAPDLDYWELKGDYGYILNRELFEKNMAEKVEALGGKIVLACLVSDRDLEDWQSKYNYIVGADGYPSVVRDWLRFRIPGHPLPLQDTHVAVQKTITMDYQPQDMIELYFGQEVAPKGYAWCFPAGGNLVRVGLGVPLSERVNAGKLLNRFIEDYGEVDSIAKLIPTARMPKTGVYGNTLLIGDALPSTDPLTGGGIMQAVASGQAAGKAVAEGKPKKYDEYIGWLRKENRRRYRLKKVLYSLTDEDYNDLIRALRGFEPKSMSVAKNLRRAFLHLLLRKPWLLRKFFRYLR